MIRFVNRYLPDPADDEFLDPDAEWMSDFVHPPTVYLWVVAVARNWHAFDGRDPDMSFRAIPVAAELGQRPAWWSDIVDAGYGQEWLVTWDRQSYGARANVIAWMMENAIAPGQPFQVALSMPYGYRCSYEYNEWEVNYHAELVQVAPLPLREGQKRWNKVWTRRERVIQQHHAMVEAQQRRQLADTRAMYLVRSFHYEGYDRDGWPYGKIGGRVVKLYSDHGAFYGRELACARHDRHEAGEEPSDQVALERLIARVQAVAPHLTPDIIRALPVRR